jgi:hypothetical protein
MSISIDIFKDIIKATPLADRGRKALDRLNLKISEEDFLEKIYVKPFKSHSKL